MHFAPASSALRKLWMVAVASTVVLTYGLSAQTCHVLHNFTYGPDGGAPSAGVTIDSGGNLYVATQYGGADHNDCFDGCGAVVKLTHKNNAWVVANLYSFHAGADGAAPTARVTIGPDGALYGTTTYGGIGDQGTLFKLRPPLIVCRAQSCPWTKTILHTFQGSPDGYNPASDVTFDHSGNLYGTTLGGGSGYGTVYEATHSGGQWTESVIYSFTPNQGSGPHSELTIDSFGNMYGTTDAGGSGLGTVYRLSPSGGGWTESVLTTFTGGNNGAEPFAGVIFDPSGNLIGATAATGNAIVFELAPSGGNWTLDPLYVFSGTFLGAYAGPQKTLTLAPDGSLYGTASGYGSSGFGSVFKLTRSGNSWVYTDLHDFSGSDGATPYSEVTLDANGNLYGTTYGGGSSNAGVVWEIAP